MGQRRKAREYALQGLYMFEMRKGEDEDAGTLLAEVTSLEWVDGDVADDIRSFAIRLITGVNEKAVEIDALINKYSKNWKLERISAVDKSILRMSLFEMLFVPEVPAAATINEGIELGKLYGGDGSGQFINGVLDAVNRTELKAGRS